MVSFEEILLCEFLMSHIEISKLFFISISKEWYCDTLKKVPRTLYHQYCYTRSENIWIRTTGYKFPFECLNFFVSFKYSFSSLINTVFCCLQQTNHSMIVSFSQEMKILKFNPIHSNHIKQATIEIIRSDPYCVWLGGH